MTVDGARVTRIELAGTVEVECGHCGTMDVIDAWIDCSEEYPKVGLDEMAETAIEQVKSEGWKQTRVGAGRRSRNGGIVCPDCASKLEPKNNGG